MSQIISFPQMSLDDISPEYLRWLNDKSLMKYSNQRFSTHSYESSSRYIESFRESKNQFHAIKLVCENNSEEAKLAGTFTIYLQENHNTADIGILIGHHDLKGKGLCNQILRNIYSSLLLNHGVERVTAGCLDVNTPMIKSLLSSGLTIEGYRAKKELFQGSYHSLIFFGGDRESIGL